MARFCKPSGNLLENRMTSFQTPKMDHKLSVKDVHRGQRLTTDFFKPFELTILVVTISISRKKIFLPWFPGGHFLRGLITKL